MQKFGESLLGSPDEQATLEENAEAEAEINAIEQDLAVGNRAIFGGVYQLLSPTADRHVQVLKTIAEEDATALRCVLAEDGARSKGLQFRFRPGAGLVCNNTTPNTAVPVPPMKVAAGDMVRDVILLF